ncbi:metalloregulator ArsR/SmtB family transcription factor [Agromyces sp. G08B096]|uniref:Metalloregulator ArsR/SmtB family transcription factor n=1 Tax=Agromyces sp. G08B096 TaxID=3156399 RepID=A0AAU7W6A3_9MICO
MAATELTLTPVGEASACCAPLTAEVITSDDAERLARRFKALGDPTRLRLLSIVAASAGQEACVCDLVDPVGLSQPTVSHHLKQLMDAGFLTRTRRGSWAYYRLVPGSLDGVASALLPAGAVSGAAAALAGAPAAV